MEIIIINQGLEHNGIIPLTIIIGDQIFFFSYNSETDRIAYNCFVDDKDLRIKLEKIIREYLTTGKNVLYYD